VQAVKVSANTHEGRRLLQAGDQGLIPARSLRTGHARDLDGRRQTHDQIEMAGRQAGMLPLRNIAHAAASVVRDERAQRRHGRTDGMVRTYHQRAVVRL
jgi:hypothetical protein